MKKPIYEQIRYLTVSELKSFPMFVLRALALGIKKEVARADLALKWVEGIIRLKESQGDDNGK